MVRKGFFIMQPHTEVRNALRSGMICQKASPAPEKNGNRGCFLFAAKYALCAGPFDEKPSVIKTPGTCRPAKKSFAGKDCGTKRHKRSFKIIRQKLRRDIGLNGALEIFNVKRTAYKRRRMCLIPDLNAVSGSKLIRVH